MTASPWPLRPGAWAESVRRDSAATEPTAGEAASSDKVLLYERTSAIISILLPSAVLPRCGDLPFVAEPGATAF